MRNRVAHLHFPGSLDTRNDIPHVARTQLLTGNHIHLQHADFVRIVFLARIEELHFVSFANHAVHNLEIGDDAPERVEYGVENQCLQRRFLIAFGMRDALDYRLKDFLHAHARLAGSADNLFALAAEQFHDFILHLFGHGACHVAFVDNGNNLQIVLDGHVKVGDGLRLHALRSIHNEQCALAGGDGARHLVGEVHVSRSVNQVQDILLALVHILHLDGMALDGDTSLLFQIHIIQHLSFGYLDGIGELQQAVGQSRFAMIDMGYDTKVTYILFHSFLKFLECKDSVSWTKIRKGAHKKMR